MRTTARLYYAMEMRDATTDWRARDGSRLRVDHPNERTALDLAKVLLEAGADPDKPVESQLHNASMCCDPKANATPFYRAAVAADVEALKLLLAYEPDLAWVPSSIKTGPRQPGNTGGKTALMVAMNGGKGVGMAGGPGDIREGTEPPFREVSNRKPVDAVTLLLRGRRGSEREDARRRLCALILRLGKASWRSCAPSSRVGPT